MPIKYACVSSGETLLGEHPAGEQPKIATTLQRVLSIVPANEHRRKTIPDKENGLNYYYLSNGEGKVVGCAASADFRLRTAFDFLEAVEPAVRVIAVNKAEPQASASAIARILKDKVTQFNDPKSDRLLELRSDIDATTDVMLTNVNKALGNIEHATNLEEKTRKLADQADDFQAKSTEVKRALCLRNAKLTAMIAGGVVGVLLIILMIACKPNFSDCSSSSASS